MRFRLSKLTGLSFLILILVSLIPYFNVLGDNAFSPQLKSEVLLKIVVETNETVVEIYRDLKAKGFLIPQEALTLYNEGLVKTTEAFSAYNSGSYQEASSLAVEALTMYKEALHVTYNDLQNIPSQSESVLEKYRQFNNTITRSYRHLNYIENIVHVLEAKGFDTATVQEKIRLVKLLLNRALLELNRHKFNLVSETLSIVRNILTTLMKHFETISSDLKISKLETYIENTDERLDVLKTKISTSSGLSSETINASLAAVQDAENNLNNAKDFLEAQMVDKVIDELLQSKESEEEALRIISNQTSTVNVSDSLNNLSLDQVA